MAKIDFTDLELEVLQSALEMDGSVDPERVAAMNSASYKIGKYFGQPWVPAYEKKMNEGKNG